MRRFQNNKPNYVIFTLSRDISKILLKCPKCYITILTACPYDRHRGYIILIKRHRLRNTHLIDKESEFQKDSKLTQGVIVEYTAPITMELTLNCKS